MQPFFARGSTGAMVELDRCAQCTRLWFDVKELEAAVGKAFLPRLRGAASMRICPVCRAATHLHTSLIQGEVPIEECAGCDGALLDDRDFELISGAKLKQEKAPPPSTPPRRRRGKGKRSAQLVEFTCARCEKRTPIAEAGTHLGFTVCRDCELTPWPDPPPAAGHRLDDDDDDFGSDLGDLLDAVVSFFTERH